MSNTSHPNESVKEITALFRKLSPKEKLWFGVVVEKMATGTFTKAEEVKAFKQASEFKRYRKGEIQCGN